MARLSREKQRQNLHLKTFNAVHHVLGEYMGCVADRISNSEKERIGALIGQVYQSVVAILGEKAN